MASLTGKKPKDTYKDLLQVSNSNSGIDSTLRFVSDGEGTDSTLKLSTASVSTTSKLVVGGDTAASDVAAIGYTSAEGLILTGQGSTSDITVKNDADAAVLTVATGTTNVDIVGDVTASTVNADGDTAASDNAAMGYTSAEGLILTGQGSTNDVTVKNDADADVLVIATGTTNVDIVGDATAATFKPDGDTAASDTAAFGYTSVLGAIITGQGSTNDVTLVNDADATVLGIATGTTNVDIVGVATAASFEPDGDTAAADNAAIGYTSAEGLILTGQGSTNDVTLKNDADGEVFGVPTGTTGVTFKGVIRTDDATDSTSGTSGSIQTDGGIGAVKEIVTDATLQPLGDTASSDKAAVGYTSAEGLILTGQGSTNDVTIKNDADGDVISIPTGTTNVTIAGDLTISGDDLVMATNTSGAALIADGTNYNPVVISGDVSIGTDGAATIADNAVSLAKMAGLARGKLIYGDSSGDPAALAVGSANYVLTSDGTDAAWAAATTGAVSSYTNSTDNRVITSVDSSTINGEANLTFDGSVLAVAGNVTATGTVEPAGDTAASDNAAIGYTSAEGLILTGQGSTSDVTIKNDADADVLTVPTGTTAPIISGQQMPSSGGLWTGRNIWINGEFTVSQRATSASSITSAGFHTVDRFYFDYSTLGTWTLSQSTDVPSGGGFGYSFKADCTTADASPAVADKLLVVQSIEGQNLQRLKKGTSDAEDITISFWVKSGLTGVHIVEIYDDDNGRSINKSYTISSADTWENHSITFAGDTTGTLTNDNGTSLTIGFWLGAGTNFTSGTLATSWESATNANRAVGQVNLANHTDNNWLITGIMVEAGSSATPFEHESYAETLQKCMRYFQLPQTWTAYSDASTATAWKIQHPFPVPMRAAPTIGTTGTPTVVKMNANAAGPNTISVVPTANTTGFTANSFTTMATGSGSTAATDTPYVGQGGFTASAEL